MSVWELSVAIEGYRKSQGAEDEPEALSEEEYLELVSGG
jgi:hypothetical protein